MKCCLAACVTARAMISPLSCVCQDPSSFCFSIICLKDSLYASICADVGSLYLILVGIKLLFGRQLNF